MTDQVQQLINRIRHDAVQAAQTQADEVLAKARAEAERLLAEARQSAAETTRTAERQAKEMHERGAQTLRLAARDLLLKVGQQIEVLVESIVAEATAKTLNAEVIEQMLLHLAKSFAENGIAEGQIQVSIGNTDRERLTQFVMLELRQRMEQGVNLHIDTHLGTGFRLSYAGGTVHHDFTAPAIAQALAQVVRPKLAELVMQAALMQSNTPALAGQP